MKIVLLDGGMGQELLKRWGKPPHPLWSAQVMMENPEIVQAIHEDYIHAGAKVITLNTYSATPERLTREGVPEQFIPLQKRGIELAKAARDRCGIEIDIAGCLPPLHGSYIPDMERSEEFLFEKYCEIAKVQAENVDLFICETMSSIAELRASTRAAQTMAKPVWSAMTLDDDNLGKLRSGENIEDAVAAIAELKPDAVLFNCSRPETITANLHFISKLPRFGAYANGFTHIAGLKIGGTVDSLSAREDLTPTKYAMMADAWMEEGATIVGGCCETGPGHISALRDQIIARGDQIVRWSER